MAVYRPVFYAIYRSRLIDCTKKALLLLYAALFAFVLPFICWGTAASPDHPHDKSHFVYVEISSRSLTVHALREGPFQESLYASWDAGNGMASLDMHPDATDGAAHSAEAPITGRAVPSTLLALLLILIGIHHLTVTRLNIYEFVNAPAMPVFLSADLLIPTPPPRCSA